MRRWKWLAGASLLALLLVAVCGLVLSQQVPPGVKYEKDVEYGVGEDVILHLDIARPVEAGPPRPCVVIIHGGGWRGGNKSDGTQLVLQLAQRGYVAATVQYRFCPTHRFPAQVEDVKCAVRFLRAHAKEYNIDPERIAAAGFSAGAHLSMMLGTLDKEDGLEGTGGNPEHSSKVQAVVAYFGPTDFSQDFPAISQGLVNDFLGFTSEENPDVFKQASPITYVDKNDAPILIFQGTKDRLVPASQATLMAEAMTKAGLNGRVELLLNADHGWGGAELERTIQASYTFLDEQLKKK